MKQLFILFIISFFTASSALAQYVIKPQGKVSPLQNEKIKPHERSGSYYNEHWNYHVMLDNKSEIYITYSISHFAGVQDAVSSARLTMLNWKDENIKVARQYDLNLLEFNEQTYKMNLHPERGVWIEGKPDEAHRFYFRTQKNGIHFDISINFEPTIGSFTWGEGIFELGDSDEVGVFSHFPFSNVSGFVALDFDTVKVSGIGNMHHTYQTNVGTRLFDRSFHFSTTTSDNFTSGYFMVPSNPSNDVIGYAYSVDGGKINLKKPSNIQFSGEQTFRGIRTAKAIKVDYYNAPSDSFVIYDLKEEEAMLDEIGGFKKMLARRLLGGDIQILRGAAIKNDQEVSFTLSRSN